MTSTTAAFSTLAVPAPDDTMDMSSPANRALDDDIDIDFDDYQPALAAFADDDQMLEDTTRPPTATDEVMGDDLQHENDMPVTEHEEVMQDHDEAVTAYDEELIDYGEEEDVFHDEVGQQTEIPDATDPLFASSDVAVDATTQDFSDAIVSHDDEADVTVTAPTEIEDPTVQHTHSDIPQLTDDAVDTVAESGFDTYLQPDAAPSPGEELAHEEDDEQYEEQLTDPTARTEHAPITVDTTRPTSTDGPDTPTDTGMHPMTVRYHDMHIPLFKSKRQLDGLLKSDNLASVSLSSLAQDCRKQLVERDYPVSEDQDIVLNFDQLGLTLVEDCHAAFDTSLEEILQVYLHLHHNEGWQEIAPLSLILSTQLKFSSSFSFLKNAAELGQGISQFSFMQSHPAGDDGEHQEYFEEEVEFDENAPHEDNHYADDEEYDGNAQLEHEEENNQEEYEQHPGDLQEHEAYDEEAGQDDFQEEAADTLDDLTGGTTNNVVHTADDQATAEDQGTVSQHQPAEHQVASPASSHTAQGDQESANATTNNNTVGKYSDDDFIDWDDEDYLTSGTSANPSPRGKDRIQDTEDKGNEASNDEQQHLTSDDWLNEEPDEQHHDQPHLEDGEQQYDESEVQNADEYEEWTHEAGEDHLDPEYPSELGDEEQYHTAHEGLFDGQAYEHGLEHTDFHQHELGNGDEPAPAGEEEEEEFDDTVIIHPQPEGEEGYEEYHHEEQHDANEFEDEINFDDEDDEQQPNLVEASSGTSLRGKRSFDEIDDLDEDDAALELPEIKKVRSS